MAIKKVVPTIIYLYLLTENSLLNGISILRRKKEEISDGLMVLQESIDKLYRLHNGKEKFFIGHYED